MKPFSINRLKELLEMVEELICLPPDCPGAILETDLTLNELQRLLKMCLKYSLQKQKRRESAKKSYQIRKQISK